jgi:hypothetical protein
MEMSSPRPTNAASALAAPVAEPEWVGKGASKPSSFLLFLQCYFSLTIVEKLLIEEDTSQMLSVAGKTIMLNAYNGKTDIAFCFSSEMEIDYDRRNRTSRSA